MKKWLIAFGSLLLGATIVTVGLGVNLSQADPISNNGNHYGQQNGNNGNHYGWANNGNGQYSQNTNYSINTTTNSNSVPGPDTLILLGAGLSGLVIWRRMSRKA